MKFQEIARGLYLEGLCPDGDSVWLADPVAGGAKRVTRRGTTQSFLDGKMWIGSLRLSAEGLLLVSGENGLVWLDPDTGESGPYLNTIGGTPIPGINEMATDPEGGLYFGTIDIPSVAKGLPPGPSNLYRLAPDGEVTEVCAGMKFANGVGVSPDGRRLYLNETFGGVWMFDIAPDGSLQNKRFILDKPDADGMAIDEQGRIWITGYKSGFLTVLHSDGTEHEKVDLPGGGCTSVRFGGEDGRDLYVNIVPGDAGDRLAVGEMPTQEDSACYRARSNVAGLVSPPPAYPVRR